MKGGVRKKEYFILVISNFITFPLIGWYIGGVAPALIGFGIALIIDRFFPTWKYELTWADIDCALRNIYKYGSNPCELCIRVDNRRIFVYRDERNNSRKGEPPHKRIRMVVRIPIKDWFDLLRENDYEQLFKQHGGKAIYSSNRGPTSYDIFAREGHEIEGCKGLLKELFELSVGGLKPDIYARSVVNAKKNIWFDYSR